MWALGIWTPGLMLAWQVLYLLSEVPGPPRIDVLMVMLLVAQPSNDRCCWKVIETLGGRAWIKAFLSLGGMCMLMKWLVGPLPLCCPLSSVSSSRWTAVLWCSPLKQLGQPPLDWDLWNPESQKTMSLTVECHRWAFQQDKADGCRKLVPRSDMVAAMVPEMVQQSFWNYITGGLRNTWKLEKQTELNYQSW